MFPMESEAMIIKNEIFYPGVVNYNTFHIDLDKPMIGHLDELNEDLIQVVYYDDYILDIGWYPEGDENGKLIIQLIHHNQWDSPIIKDDINDMESLISDIYRIKMEIDRLKSIEDGKLRIDG